MFLYQNQYNISALLLDCPGSVQSEHQDIKCIISAKSDREDFVLMK